MGAGGVAIERAKPGGRVKAAFGGCDTAPANRWPRSSSQWRCLRGSENRSRCSGCRWFSEKAFDDQGPYLDTSAEAKESASAFCGVAAWIASVRHRTYRLRSRRNHKPNNRNGITRKRNRKRARFAELLIGRGIIFIFPVPYKKSSLVLDSKMEILLTLLVYRIESKTNASDVVMFTSVCEE